MLPAQALDHATGYVMAAAVLRALTLRHRESGSWHVQLSLAQTATWLLARRARTEGKAVGTVAGAATAGGTAAAGASADASAIDVTSWLDTVGSHAGRLTYVLPPLRVDGGPRTWSHPPLPLGASPPAWLWSHSLRSRCGGVP
ncbi:MULTISPECIES: hypothetical protein [Protofrankia]|uniref:hypothetical protein n=1 Tax=Protofrankia TaxID=2994361 RepID=UPI0001C53618|nr:MULTISPECIES: hypothetical protein [Protofrankia]